MSIEAVAEFTNKLAEDEALQQELQSVAEDKEGLDASQAVSELGAKYGYEFTAEEAQTLRQIILAQQSGELSEDQLEAVAGGGPIGRMVGSYIGDKVGDIVGGLLKKVPW